MIIYLRAFVLYYSTGRPFRNDLTFLLLFILCPFRTPIINVLFRYNIIYESFDTICTDSITIYKLQSVRFSQINSQSYYVISRHSCTHIKSKSELSFYIIIFFFFVSFHETTTMSYHAFLYRFTYYLYTLCDMRMVCTFML